MDTRKRVLTQLLSSERCQNFVQSQAPNTKNETKGTPPSSPSLYVLFPTPSVDQHPPKTAHTHHPFKNANLPVASHCSALSCNRLANDVVPP